MQPASSPLPRLREADSRLQRAEEVVPVGGKNRPAHREASAARRQPCENPRRGVLLPGIVGWEIDEISFRLIL